MKEVRNELSFGVEALQSGVVFLSVGQEALYVGLDVGQLEESLWADVDNNGVEDILGCRAVSGVGVPLDDVAKQLVEAGRVQSSDGRGEVRSRKFLDESQCSERLGQGQRQLDCLRPPLLLDEVAESLVLHHHPVLLLLPADLQLAGVVPPGLQPAALPPGQDGVSLHGQAPDLGLPPVRRIFKTYL